MIVCEKCGKPVNAGKTFTSEVTNLVKRFRYCKECGITYVTCEIVDYKMDTKTGRQIFNVEG